MWKWLVLTAAVVAALPLTLVLLVSAAASPGSAAGIFGRVPTALAKADIPAAYLVLYMDAAQTCPACRGRCWPANPAIAALTGRAAARHAVQLRPSLVGTGPRRLAPRDAGLALGRLLRAHGGRGPAVCASWEDTIVAFMAPRTGRTTAQAIPFVLSAPGAVIATSNKADLWAATAALRGAAGSAVWLSDPQHITHQPQTWWWNPLHQLTTVEEAHRLAGHFVLTVADEHRAGIDPAHVLAICEHVAISAGHKPVGYVTATDDGLSCAPLASDFPERADI